MRLLNVIVVKTGGQQCAILDCKNQGVFSLRLVDGRTIRICEIHMTIMNACDCIQEKAA